MLCRPRIWTRIDRGLKMVANVSNGYDSLFRISEVDVDAEPNIDHAMVRNLSSTVILSGSK